IDRSGEFGRLAILGPHAAEVLKTNGWGSFGAMPQLQHAALDIAGSGVRIIRDDFLGVPGWTLVVPRESLTDVRDKLTQGIRMAVIDAGPYELNEDAARALRIESGIPASVDDIDEDVLPPETGQIESGISYHKGCYLGQEVIERMRSHGVLARRLVGLWI